MAASYSFHLQVLLLFTCCCHVILSSGSDGRRGSLSWRLPGRRYQVTDINDEDWSSNDDDDDDDSTLQHPLRVISGREFDLFDSSSSSSRRKRNTKDSSSSSSLPSSSSSSSSPSSSEEHAGDEEPVDVAGRLAPQDLSQGRPSLRRNTADDGDLTNIDNEKLRTIRQASATTDGSSSNSYHFYSRSSGTKSGTPKFSQYGRPSLSQPSSKSNSGGGSLFLIPPPVAEWWTANVTPNIKNLPKLQCRIEPTTTLKIRKTFRPLKTIVQLGADFNTQLGVWQFKSSWEDAIIGGKLTLAGRELQLTKSWQLSVGAVEDLVTRLRLRAAVDLQNYKAYVRVGFRTERLAPINVMEGFTLMKQVPLDGNAGHVKLEVKANVALPEPEIEYSTETQRSLIGMGNIEVSIEELNLVLDY